VYLLLSENGFKEIDLIPRASSRIGIVIDTSKYHLNNSDKPLQTLASICQMRNSRLLS